MWFNDWSNTIFGWPIQQQPMFPGSPPPPATTSSVSATTTSSPPPVHNLLWQEVFTVLSTYDPEAFGPDKNPAEMEAAIGRCYQALASNKMLFPDPLPPAAPLSGSFYIH